MVVDDVLSTGSEERADWRAEDRRSRKQECHHSLDCTKQNSPASVNVVRRSPVLNRILPAIESRPVCSAVPHLLSPAHFIECLLLLAFALFISYNLIQNK